jgi:ribosomal-protein-alanine N-acetyltransferase
MTTPSTCIRLLKEDDAEALATHLARDAGAFARWELPRPPESYTTAGQGGSIKRLLSRHESDEAWPGVVLADDVVIGQITVQKIMLGPWRKAAIGYWIACPYQGQGHATRAVGLAVQVMIRDLELHRAEAFTQMDNLGSQHVLRSNGFVPFGVARSHVFIAGKWRDEIWWERLLD